jgi:hypothetical protein
MISGDPFGCGLFCKKFAKNRSTFNICYEDFIHAFLPINLDHAKQMLQRHKKIENILDVKDLKTIFNSRTFS